MRDSQTVEKARRDLGAELAAYRRAAGYSQAAFAALVDYSRSTIANVETGRQHVPPGFWKRADTTLHADGALVKAHNEVETAAWRERRGDAAARSRVGLVEQWDPPSRSSLKAALGVSLSPVVSGDAASPAVFGSPGSWPDNGENDSPHHVTEEADPTRRRDALKLGLAASVAPQALQRVLREAAADAMEFTRQSGSSGVGKSALDHLEAVAIELGRAYSTRPAADLFAVARAYRLRVHELIQGRHSLTEGRRLYVYAAWLDGLLAWLTFDLGDLLTAQAFAIDCFEHAAQAGHNELCAWATASMADNARFQNRPDRALSAAAKGVQICPVSHPLAVRLRATAARAHAQLGNRDECEDLLSESRRLWDGMSATAPATLDPGTLEDYALCAYPATVYLSLRDFGAAKRHAEEAVAIYEARAQRVDAFPTSGAMSRLYLGIALAEMGQPNEAIGQGVRALNTTRMSHGVRTQAWWLDEVIMRRYPNLPQARQFHEQCRATVSARAAGS